MNHHHHQLLPIIAYKDKIIESFKRHDTLIIIGETGSGKSTQVPVMLYKSFHEIERPNSLVAVTQPRRVAAIALAKRVSENLDTELGQQVGYSVRFDEACSPSTRIKYVTDGMLLREALSEPDLLGYGTIILDEAHERTLRTDILFGLLKRLQAKRQHCRNRLKLVIMSATLNPSRFVQFFSDSYVLNIPGRQHPVKLCYTAQPQQDYLDAAVITIFQLHRDPSKQGDILVFLTGQEEIDMVGKLLEEYGPSCPPPAPKLLVVPIYAALSSSQQMAVFGRTPRGCRKIVLATNIAETSITIPGIRFVIDPGFVKMRTFNPKMGMEALSVVPVSRASARQRTGRAGREAPGECYRLFMEEAFKNLEDETPPEILCTNLSNVILTMKACGIDNVIAFDYLEPPPLDALAKGLEELLALDALTVDGKLSKIGKVMAECPLLPTLSRVLVESKDLQCSDEVLSIISMLSVENVFLTSARDRDQGTMAKLSMSHGTGDHISLLNIFRAFMAATDPERWCQNNFIDYKGMRQVVQVRNQLVGFCEKNAIQIISCQQDLELPLRCFCAGFHPQVALLQPDKTYRALIGRQQTYIHPSSVLHNRKPECVIFNELTLTTKCYMRGVSVIQPDWVYKFIKKSN